MRTLKIIFGNIKKDALHNIVMMAFVGVAIFIMEIALSRFRFQEYTNDLVKDCGMYDNYMYVSTIFKDAYDKEHKDGEAYDPYTSKSYLAYENLADQIEQLKAEGIIEACYSRDYFGAPITEDDIDDRGQFLIFPRGLAEDVAFPLSRGAWFSEYKQNDGALPVIIGSDFAGRFHIGDRIMLPVFSQKFHKSMYGECVVIGVLERNAMILNGGGSSTDMDTNFLFGSGNDTFIACVDESELSEDFRGYYVKVAPENRQTVMERIGDLSMTFTFAEMSDRAYENNRLMTEMVTALFVIMMLVCAAGVSSGNLLATISCKKRYAVYFLCGMEWKTGFLVSLIESVIKLVLPAAVGYIAFMRFCVKNQFGEMRVGTINFVVMAAFLLIIFLLTSLKPLSDIKRTSPVGIIVGS